MSGKVSIILTVYNGERYLDETIQSVFQQNYKNRELIIINDSSKDRSSEIARQYLYDKRVYLIENSENLNIVWSRNLWLSVAKGEYICFLDQDDIILQEKLTKQVCFLEIHKEYWLVGCNIIDINEDGETIWKTIVPEEDKLIRNRILRSSQFACWAVLIRKDILDQIWILNPIYIKSDDYDLWLRIGIISKMHNIQIFLFKYRYHLNNTSNNSYKEMTIKSIKLCIKYRNYYPNFLFSIILWFGYLILPKSINNLILKYIKR